MQKVTLTEILSFRKKGKEHKKKKLDVNLLELIRVKKAMMQTMKQTEC